MSRSIVVGARRNSSHTHNFHPDDLFALHGFDELLDPPGLDLQGVCETTKWRYKDRKHCDCSEQSSHDKPPSAIRHSDPPFTPSRITEA